MDAKDLPKSVKEWVANQDKLFGHLEKLPQDWIRIKSTSSGKVYFYNTRIGESRDENNPPVHQLPAGWQRMTSKSSGNTYYYNSKTGQSQFEKPLM